LKNIFIPKGTNVSVNASAIHKNPKYYENPHVFDPERWIKDSEKL
jgi:cytochrome P450